MFAGDPGSGKSSICFDILGKIKETCPTKKVGYVSAEMTEIDVKEFEQYNKNILDIEFLFINNYVINPILGIKPFQALISFLNRGYDVVVFDSFVEIQEMIKEDFSLSAKKAEKYLLDLMGRHNKGQNKENLYTTFMAIQQKTKGGTYVGSKRLEHMTTAFLNIVRNRHEKKTYMYFEKNRKGEIGMKMFYKLGANGIEYDFNKYENELNIQETAKEANDFNLEKININELSNLFKGITSKKELQKEMAGM
jgi:predicted ATP-dependent serine protease